MTKPRKEDTMAKLKEVNIQMNAHIGKWMKAVG